MSIAQPPREGRGGKPGGRPGGGSGPTPDQSGGRSGNGRNGGPSQQRSASGRSPAQGAGGNRQPAQKNPSQKTAGNRNVNAKNLGQGSGRPASGGKPGAGRPDRQGRGPARTPVQVPARRPSPTQLGLGAVFVVIIVVLVIVLVGVNKPAGKQQGTTLTAATAALVAKVTGIPESVAEEVGLPSVITNIPKKVTGETPLSSSGEPIMLYMGAEYCPFCAAERWAMVIALSKFGTFTGLKTTNSSVTDFAPDTATFTFYGSSYKSKYLIFQPEELASNEPAASNATCNVNTYACLDIPSTADDNLLQKLGGGSFPFMDFNNKLFQSGSGYGDQPLVLAGLTGSEIASALYQPKGSIAQAEVGSANYLTAAICAMTGNTPSSVCSASYIKPAQKKAGIS